MLAAQEVLLDLHSFHTAGEPFAMVGPRDNPGPREPFARAAEELALARALGAPQVVQGWLEVYDQAARARGDREVLLHAQSSAAAFYRRAGFVAQGEPFDEVGIAHITMVLGL